MFQFTTDRRIAYVRVPVHHVLSMFFTDATDPPEYVERYKFTVPDLTGEPVKILHVREDWERECFLVLISHPNLPESPEGQCIPVIPQFPMVEVIRIATKPRDSMADEFTHYVKCHGCSQSRPLARGPAYCQECQDRAKVGGTAVGADPTIYRLPERLMNAPVFVSETYPRASDAPDDYVILPNQGSDEEVKPVEPPQSGSWTISSSS